LPHRNLPEHVFARNTKGAELELEPFISAEISFAPHIQILSIKSRCWYL
jgi:hypothetical protein